MTTIVANPPAPPAAPAIRPAQAQPGATATAPGAVDPFKLLQRYKWLLIAAVIVGAGLGTTAHFVWMRVYPLWQPRVLFEAKPQMKSAGDIAPIFEEARMKAFMGTEARLMTSDTVLQRVVEDPQIQQAAPIWCAQFMGEDSTTKQQRFNTLLAARELKDYVSARPIPQSFLVELSVTYKNKYDATAILRLMREKYTALREEQARASFQTNIDALNSQMRSIDGEITALVTRRENLIRERNLGSANTAVSNTQDELRKVNDKYIEIDQQRIPEAKKVIEQLEEQKNNPAGPEIGADIKADAEQDRTVQEVKSLISALEGQRQSLITNHGPDHREIKQLERRIAGQRQALERALSEATQKLFDAQIESARKALAILQAQADEMRTSRQTLERRLTDLNSAQQVVEDLRKQIDELTRAKALQSDQLSNVTGVQNIGAENRMVVAVQERVPTFVSFPKIEVMIPLGMAITLGLVGTLVLLRELVDQRVRGPSDIGIIPRTRFLGWVPDASEDPAGSGPAENAFRDRPRGIVAEAFRQLRATVTKRIGNQDHRVILVAGGMPGSGSTTVVINLAMAFTAAEKRVLVIDANFRRPSLHRVLGLQEAPGLSDALARGRDLAAVTQATATANLDLLSAGTREARVVERLTTDAMSELLAQAREAYDLVLIDVPPAIVAGDAVALAHKCDGSMLVVRALAEKRGMVARLKNELTDARAEFLGVVVNGVKSAAGGYMKRNIKAAAEYQEA